MTLILPLYNFLFCIYFNYLERYESDIKKERNRILANLFRNIKSSLMGGVMNLGKKKINITEKVKEILGEKDEDKRKFKLLNLDFYVECSFKYPHILGELIDLKFKFREMNFAEMEANLILYCILVNGLDKTKGKKFDQIKKEMQPLIKILKEIFCEFDKNEIHKERTFIFALRSPAGYHDDFYIINNKDDMLRSSSDDDNDYDDDDEDVKSMHLYLSTNKDEKDKKDERKFKYYAIVLDHSLHGDEKEYKL